MTETWNEGESQKSGKPQEAPAEVVPENKELRGLGLFMDLPTRLDRLLDAMIRVFPCLAWLLFWERFLVYTS